MNQRLSNAQPFLFLNSMSPLQKIILDPALCDKEEDRPESGYI